MECVDNGINERTRLNEEISANNIYRNAPSDDVGAEHKANLIPRLTTFLETNVRKLWKPRFHSGSVVLLNEEDTNVKFTCLSSDVIPIVDTTTISQRMQSSPDLLSGGTVVLEGFAENVKLRNYYAEDPMVIELPNQIKVSESSVFIPKSTKPRVFARSFSGGDMTDNSLKGVSLPDLFSSKESEFKDYCPSKKHLSGGGLVECDVQNEIFLDLLSKRLKVQGLNTSQSAPVSSPDNDYTSMTNNSS